MADYKILQGGVTETVRANEEGKFVALRVVRYMVGTHGPFTLQIDAKDFSAAKVDELLAKEALEVRKLAGEIP